MDERERFLYDVKQIGLIIHQWQGSPGEIVDHNGAIEYRFPENKPRDDEDLPLLILNYWLRNSQSAKTASHCMLLFEAAELRHDPSGYRWGLVEKGSSPAGWSPISDFRGFLAKRFKSMLKHSSFEGKRGNPFQRLVYGDNGKHASFADLWDCWDILSEDNNDCELRPLHCEYHELSPEQKEKIKEHFLELRKDKPAKTILASKIRRWKNGKRIPPSVIEELYDGSMESFRSACREAKRR